MAGEPAEARFELIFFNIVMAGLDPAIHDFKAGGNPGLFSSFRGARSASLESITPVFKFGDERCHGAYGFPDVQLHI